MVAERKPWPRELVSDGWRARQVAPSEWVPERLDAVAELAGSRHDSLADSLD